MKLKSTLLALISSVVAVATLAGPKEDLILRSLDLTLQTTENISLDGNRGKVS
ncbi:MAG: hypothetical protein K2X47_16810 [Bdellovibrionales bacterium]|nr:hypothetical protein [Bdellovibrionales bacterium]